MAPRTFCLTSVLRRALSKEKSAVSEEEKNPESMIKMTKTMIKPITTIYNTGKCEFGKGLKFLLKPVRLRYEKSDTCDRFIVYCL